GRAVADPADDVRMTNAVERDRLVLKILDQGPLEIVIKIIMQEYVQRLDDDLAVGRLCRCERVTGEKDLGIAALPEPLANVISLIEPAVVQRKLFHRCRGGASGILSLDL